jgi:hypothetical protein
MIYLSLRRPVGVAMLYLALALVGIASSLKIPIELARIIWAVWKHERGFDGNHLPQAQAA